MTVAGETSGPPAAREAIWHEVECGAYAADVAVWDDLVAGVAGPALELGAGTGRVSLRLAAAGHQVTALDSAPALVAELSRRAQRIGVELEAVLGDARDFDLGKHFAAVLAPRQRIHLLGGADGRAAMLGAAATHLRPGGLLAAALLADDGAGPAGADSEPPLPDVREVDGWIFSSLPLEVRDTGSAIEIRRLRQLVSPAGELSEELDAISLDLLDPAQFEREAATAGFVVRERVAVSPTADHVGSVVCILEAA